MLLTEKYSPKSLDEFISLESIKFVREWYSSGHKKPLLITGSVGVGKSTLARLISNEFNLTLYELTPSDSRSKDDIEKETLAVSLSHSVFGKKNLLFFDDIDVFFKDDKGGFETILKISKESSNPVVFALTNLYNDKKNLKVKEISEVLALKKPNYLSIKKLLTNICIAENISYDDEVLLDIAKNCDGDLRSAILDIDYLSFFGINKKSILTLSRREKKYDVFKSITNLFKATNLKEAIKIRDESDIDFDLYFAWICENLHLFYEKENLFNAIKLASLGDINRSRIYKRQNWTFLKYYILLGMVAPATFAKKDKFSFKINYPTFIQKMSKESSIYAKNKKISEVLSKIFHGSKSRIISEVEFYKLIFSNKENFLSISNRINDSEKESLVENLSLPKEFLDLNYVEPKKEPVVETKKQRTLFS